jgi:hypothetical protein
MSNNSTTVLVTNDAGFIMHVTTHGHRPSDDHCVEGLVLGHHAVTKRGLFRKKTVIPFILFDIDVMRHIAVYGGNGYGINDWLEALATQKMRSGWSVWFVDFFGDQRTAKNFCAAAEDSGIPSSSMDSRFVCNTDIPGMLKVARMAVYLHLNGMAAGRSPAKMVGAIGMLQQAISERFYSVMANDLRPVLMIFNGLQQGDETMPLIVNMLAQSRLAKVGLVLRFHERPADMKWQQAIDASACTHVDFNFPELRRGWGEPAAVLSLPENGRHIELPQFKLVTSG